MRRNLEDGSKMVVPDVCGGRGGGGTGVSLTPSAGQIWPREVGCLACGDSLRLDDLPPVVDMGLLAMGGV